ncbi:MAG: T9SS type A sorting domain-containing protein [Bacteroidetes bacterium]|nr:T9SS type A sorting domain-containing protein [Bacteroidota bacterium]
MNTYRLFLAGILLLLPLAMHAQEMRLSRSVIAAGAMHTSDAHGGIAGTVGQPVIGLSTSSEQRLGQGFWYRIGATGTAVEQPPVVASAVSLGRNYPNPFGPGAPGSATSTRIEITLPAAAHTTLTLHDLMGRSRFILIDERLQAGVHTVQLDAGRLPAGVYICRLEATGMIRTRSMVLVR